MKKGISGKESKLAMLVPFTEKELLTVLNYTGRSPDRQDGGYPDHPEGPEVM